MDSNFRFLVVRPSNRHGRRDCCLENGSGSVGEPKVRISLPPALSPLRTSFSGGKRGKVRGRQGTIPTVSTSSGTDGSNPAPSSGESVSRGISPSLTQKPGFSRGCAGRGRRRGRQRQA